MYITWIKINIKRIDKVNNLMIMQIRVLYKMPLIYINIPTSRCAILLSLYPRNVVDITVYDGCSHDIVFE